MRKIFKTLVAGITTIETGALQGCSNLKKLDLRGIVPDEEIVPTNGKSKKSKISFGKNSLKKTSKKLTILVKSKTDQKAVKKQLKKAGNTKAKVKVQKK